MLSRAHMKKTILPVLFFLAATTLLLYSRDQPPYTTTQEQASTEHTKAITDISISTTLPERNKKEIPKNEEKEIYNQLLDEYESSQLLQWNRQRGHFTDNDLAEYKSYDISELAKLANDGDLKALELIARDSLAKGDMSGAFDSFIKAAVYGSTHALSALSLLVESQYLTANNPQEKLDYAIETLALLEAAKIRGDVFTTPQTIESFKSRNHFHPSPDQSQLINQKAGEIYEHLNESRKTLGLPEFDNSTDKKINKIISKLKLY